jgi:transposase-like protein
MLSVGKSASQLVKKAAEIEIKPNFTKEDFWLWYERFLFGQKIFNTHVNNQSSSSIIPFHLCPSYNGRQRLIAYVEGEHKIVATFATMEKVIKGIKQCLNGANLRSTNVHLVRMGICTSSLLMPIFTGIEESAHAYFHLHVKPKLKPEEIVYTGRYDGSDSSEEYAFQQLLQIILVHKELELFPLPQNFCEIFSNLELDKKL